MLSVATRAVKFEMNSKFVQIKKRALTTTKKDEFSVVLVLDRATAPAITITTEYSSVRALVLTFFK